ncbi:glycosyltransferase [Fredinandcohnia onubensis]|uniref:glycosyltransferase n=1 Tax=Fredinandcohnia onubensis TaxID=1571209 RepID=UPI000C0C0B74|nr:glycosyltransferase [Fredinandcohnia onubensis]
MKHYYCSTFSKDYTYKGLLLYHSLEKHDKDFEFFMICLHEEAKALFEKMNLPHATIISMEEIEKDDKELLSVKNSRNDKEYIWSSKASICLYLFKHFSEINHIVWLDGDTLFLSDPEPIFTEWGDYSITLTEEKWREEHSFLGDTNGVYNTGYMGFKRDEHAMECLHWFREKLIEWCFDKWEHGLWSDQVYANDWMKRFKNVGIIENIGVNLTPYIINYRYNDRSIIKSGNDIYIDHERVIFFHYYGFKYYDGNVFDICHYVMNQRDDVIEHLYIPYLNACNEIMDKIKAVDNTFTIEKNSKDYHVRNYFNLQANMSTDETYDLCTIISVKNLAQGLALYHSLKKHTPNFRLWICCLDDRTYSLLNKMNLDHAILITLKNIEGNELLSIKDSRSFDEYSRTLKASFISYILKNHYTVKSVIYTDADMYFFTDVRNVFHELNEQHPVSIVPRRASAEEEKKYGVYDSGLIGFYRNEISFDCLFKWKKDCVNWCFDVVEDGRWADQKYLDQWIHHFPTGKVIETPHTTAGPWNVKESLHADKLFAYHYSGFVILNQIEFDLCNTNTLNENMINSIYSPYVKAVKEEMEKIKSVDEHFYKSDHRSNADYKALNYFQIDHL